MAPSIVGRLTKPVRQSQLLETIYRSPPRARPPTWHYRPRNRIRVLPRTIPKAARARCRLLLAEDNEVNCVVALEILTVAGFHCDVAKTGREAIELLLLTPYDAVLMDCQMPEMDGLAASARYAGSRPKAHCGNAAITCRSSR